MITYIYFVDIVTIMLIDEVLSEIQRIEEKKREGVRLRRGEGKRYKDFKKILEILYKMRDGTQTAEDMDTLQSLLEKYRFVFEGVPTVEEAITEVPVGELRLFEEDILADVAERGAAAGRKGRWIRGHLLEVGDDYTEAMYKKYKQFCTSERTKQVLRGPINPGTYGDFRRYMYLLRWLGLIEESRRERSSKPHLRSIVSSVKGGKKKVEVDGAVRVYYRLTDYGKSDPVFVNRMGVTFDVWQNPQLAWELLKEKKESSSTS